MTQALLSVPYRPQEVIAGARPVRLRQVSLALASATLTILVLASSSLARWAEDLDVSALNDMILTAVSGWDHWLHAVGLAVPFDLLRDAFERFRSLA